jgi:hypothetical protein
VIYATGVPIPKRGKEFDQRTKTNRQDQITYDILARFYALLRHKRFEWLSLEARIRLAPLKPAPPQTVISLWQSSRRGREECKTA